MNFTVFLWLLFFQLSPNLEQQIAEGVVLHYLRSKENSSSGQKYFVSEVMDTVYVRRYSKVLDPKNDLIFKDLSSVQKDLVFDLFEFKEPLSFDLKNLSSVENFRIFPRKEFDENDWESSTIKVSRVSISLDQMEACLILEYVCGSKCGVGVLIFVRKEMGDWKVNQMKHLWIA